MIKKVKNRITEYLGFDVDKLLNAGDFVTIFGGAVRDPIADLEIHDIDVMCLWKSMRKCELLLDEMGYIYDESAYTKDFDKLYEGIRVVHEPKSWIKIVDGNIRRVQLIRPQFRKYNSKSCEFTEIKDIFNKLLKNVDLSCCGVSLDKNGLKEQCLNAYAHCICEVYEEVPDALMITDRLTHRKEKLNGRGWDDIHGLCPKRKKDKLILTLKQLSLNKKIKKIKN